MLRLGCGPAKLTLVPYLINASRSLVTRRLRRGGCWPPLAGPKAGPPLFQAGGSPPRAKVPAGKQAVRCWTFARLASWSATSARSRHTECTGTGRRRPHSGQRVWTRCLHVYGGSHVQVFGVHEALADGNRCWPWADANIADSCFRPHGSECRSPRRVQAAGPAASSRCAPRAGRARRGPSAAGRRRRSAGNARAR